MATQKIAVIGSGLMGRGIAHVSALGGLETVMVDINQEVLDKSFNVIKKDMENGVERKKLTIQDMDNALARFSVSTDIAKAVKDAQIIIEAIPEEMDLKWKTYKQINASCSPNAVIASNTSALSITELASVLDNPSRFIGMHFFNPPHKMKLVEIIRGLETSDETYKIAEEVTIKIGKEPVEVNEAPGFVTSRINVMIGNEAFYMLQEGVASARNIDKALKLGLNHPMGPFELVDLVGLDTRIHVLEYLYKALGEKFRPCPLMVKYVKAGRLGRKVGKGVYDYTE